MTGGSEGKEGEAERESVRGLLLARQCSRTTQGRLIQRSRVKGTQRSVGEVWIGWKESENNVEKPETMCHIEFVLCFFCRAG